MRLHRETRVFQDGDLHEKGRDLERAPDAKRGHLRQERGLARAVRPQQSSEQLIEGMLKAYDTLLDLDQCCLKLGTRNSRCKCGEAIFDI